MPRFTPNFVNLDAQSSVGSPAGLGYLSPNASGTAPNGKQVLTLDQAVANLTRTGGQWPVTGHSTITYSFLEKAPGGQYNNPHESYLGGLVSNFSPFTTDQRDAARASIQLWDDLVAVTFKEINGKGADIVFMNTGEGGPGQAAAFIPQYSGKYHKINGDVYVNGEQPDNFDLNYGGYGQTAITHEIGHAIGLSHTGDYNAGDGVPITYANSAQFFQDSYQYSIMSYFSSRYTGAKGYVNWATGGYYQTPQTPMVHDIAAAQSLYGADLTTRTGDTTYGFHSNAGNAVFNFDTNQAPFLSIYDAGGNDTLDLSGFTGGYGVLDLRPGAFSTGYNYGSAAQLNALWGVGFSQAQWNAIYDGKTGNPGFLTENIGIAYNTVIENGKTGAGQDILTGNDVDNRLDAGAGNDSLNGGKGDDWLTGGAGSDKFVFADLGGRDTITDFVSGTDKIDLAGIDANSGVAGDQAFTFIGNAGFSNVAGQLRSYSNSTGLHLAGDVNGDGVADFTIHLGSAAVAAGDLFL